jgi:hypothetical protein
MLRPNEQRGKIAVTMVMIVMVVEIVSFISDAMQLGVIGSIIEGEYIPEGVVDSADIRQMVIALLFLAVFVISGITFIQWFRRAYFNLHQRAKGLSAGESAAAYTWFIPIVNFYQPYQIMKELYRETHRVLRERVAGYSSDISLTTVGWWWTLWIITTILSQISFQITLRSDSPDGLWFSTVVGMISSAIDIPLALITVKVIRDYAKMEPLLENALDENEERIRAMYYSIAEKSDQPDQ